MHALAILFILTAVALAILAFRPVIRFLSARNNPLLKAEFRKFPKLREFIFRPYVNSDWWFYERIAAIEGHYLLIKDRLPFLAAASEPSFDLTELKLGADSLRIVLDKPHWMRGEGEIGLSLFHGVDRIYTAMFLLHESAGRLQLVVGNLQGDGRDRGALYKEFTKTLHGMRPRDFLVHVTKMVGEELGCSDILGISDEAHRSSHWLTKAKKVSTYDAIWLEHGGVKESTSGFFRLPARFTKRPDTEVPANKRAQYRRRYQLMDELKIKLSAALRGRRSGEPLF